MKETMHTHILATEHQSFAAGKTVAGVWHGLSRRAGACEVLLLAAAVLLSPTQPVSAEDAMTILPNGNVGIGATKPGSLLDVNGTVQLRGFKGGTGLVVDAKSNVGIGATKPDSLLDVDGTVQLRGFKGGTGLVVDAKSNVGIGNKSPLARLHVYSGTQGSAAPAAVFEGHNCGLACGQPTWTEAARLWNTNPLGRVGLGFLSLENRALTNLPNVYIGTGQGKNKNDFRIATNVKDVLTDRMVINGDNGNVGIGRMGPEAKLDVDGDVRIRGKVSSYARYQRDDQTESTYGLSPRYHLSLTAAKYAGRTKAIPQETLVALCGDTDGCEARLGMTHHSPHTGTQTASIQFLFYYSTKDHHWRTSDSPSAAGGAGWGVDNDGTRQDVAILHNTCFFMDATFEQKIEKGDHQVGMELLVWDGLYPGQIPYRTCELTLID